MDFDWITAREQCSVLHAFLKLRADVEQDVNNANKVFRESRRRFGFTPAPESFTIYEDRIPPRHISFTLNDTNTLISVSDENDKHKFDITVTLNKEKQCVFVIDGEELEGWQVRKRAIEPLLFSIRVMSANGFKGV
jgi:hypothetical protein